MHRSRTSSVALMLTLTLTLALASGACAERGPMSASSAPKVSDVRLTLSSAQTWVGYRSLAVAEFRGSDGNSLSLTGYRWASSNPNVATIDGNGGIAALREGRTIISLRYGALTAEAELDVVRPQALRLYATAANTTLVPGMWTMLNVIITRTDMNGAAPRAQFRSSDPRVATVDTITGLVEAISPGRAEIRTTLGPLSYSLWVNVEAQRATTVAMPYRALELGVADTIPLVAAVLDQMGSWLADPVTFTSSDTTVASVRNGRVEARRIGNATITATAGSLHESISVEVRDTPPAPLALTTSNRPIRLGLSRLVTVANGPRNGLRAGLRVWAEPTGRVALRVTDNGIVVSALEPGSVIVHAAFAGRRTSTALNVSALSAVVTCEALRDADVRMNSEWLGFVRPSRTSKSALDERNAYSLLNPFGRYTSALEQLMSSYNWDPVNAELRLRDSTLLQLAGSPWYDDEGADNGISVDYVSSCATRALIP